jgi:ubiquitin-hydrolase Zn-finger-containing protein
MAVPCSHADQVEILEPSGEIAGCEECLKAGGRWVHLRMCQTCGRIGCCDSSPGRHASRHAAEAGHPVLRSVEPGETWSWCVVDEVGFDLTR